VFEQVVSNLSLDGQTAFEASAKRFDIFHRVRIDRVAEASQGSLLPHHRLALDDS